MALNDYAYYRQNDGYIENVIYIDDAVAPTLVWPDGYAIVDIPEGGVAGEWTTCGVGWSYINGQFVEPPKPVPVPPTAEQNKAKAERLLLETDWVNQPDVIDPSVNPHLLNHADFIAYRAQLREIAVTPQAGDLTWPTKPQEQWST